MAFKNVSAMSDFVQTVLWGDLKNVIFVRLKLKKSKRMKFWNIIIIFAYICIYVKECSQAGMAYLSWL